MKSLEIRIDAGFVLARELWASHQCSASRDSAE